MARSSSSALIAVEPGARRIGARDARRSASPTAVRPDGTGEPSRQGFCQPRPPARRIPLHNLRLAGSIGADVPRSRREGCASTSGPARRASSRISCCASSIMSPPASACCRSANPSRMVQTRPPTRSRASKTVTSAPSATRSCAAESPARPAPATTTDAPPGVVALTHSLYPNAVRVEWLSAVGCQLSAISCRLSARAR